MVALIKNTNSYNTVAEANEYLDNKLDVAAWTSANDDQKAQALITATALLDSMDWAGTAISDSQSLAFPRDICFYDNKLGRYIEINETPRQILEATNELAYHLLNNDGLLDDTGSVTNLSIGSLNLTIKNMPSLVPQYVRKILRPLLRNEGQHTWWRAN